MQLKELKNNKPEKYTGISLVWHFLEGSKAYFLISIVAALAVNGLDMITPQIIRTTVDNVLGDEPLKLPGFLMEMVQAAGGVEYLKRHLWIMGLLIILVAICSALFRYWNTRYCTSFPQSG